MIIGIDPGQNTGVACFQSGKLVSLRTHSPCQIPEICAGAKRVIFEDSRLQSFSWNTSANRQSALKIARNLGEIDAWCKLIVAVCADLGIPAHGISPKDKGAKLTAEQFNAFTGWDGKSNAHERDACMVAYPYRSAA